MKKQVLHHNNPGGYFEKYREKGYKIHFNSCQLIADNNLLDLIKDVRYRGLYGFTDSLNNVSIESRKSKGHIMLDINNGKIHYSVYSLHYPLTDQELQQSCCYDLINSYEQQIHNIKDYLEYLRFLERKYYYSSTGTDNLIKDNFEVLGSCSSCNSKLDKVNVNYSYYLEDHQYFEVMVDNVLAWYCLECGEFYFDNEIISKIKKEVRRMHLRPEYHGDAICFKYIKGRLKEKEFGE